MENFGEVTEPRTVRLERTLPGPIERVWSYLTDSDKRGKWFASGPMELRVGARFTFTFNNDDLSADKDTPERFKKTRGMNMQGRVLRCEPPRVLSFTFFETDEAASEVTFDLTPKGSEVLLVITHRRLASRHDMVMVGAGWHTHVGVLIDVLNNEEPRPFWKTFERLEPEYEKRITE